MGYPELDHDEPVILESRNITFNSILFDAILTHKRIHLTASKKTVIPIKNIILSTIMDVKTGENAIRDHFLILTLITESGQKHQEFLTFARQAGVERKRECHEWAKKLKSLILPATPVIPFSDVPELDREPLTKHEVPTPEQRTAPGTRPVTKKIPIVRPVGTTIEKISGAPEPGETPSTPPGSFCSRCGNRVHLKSTFCSRCGTPVKRSQGADQESQPVASMARVSVPPPVSKHGVTKEPEKVLPQVPAPVSRKEPEKVLPSVPAPVVRKEPEKVLHTVPAPVSRKEPEKVLPSVPTPVVRKEPEKVLPSVPAPVVRKEPEKVLPPVLTPVVRKEPEKVLPTVGFPEESQENSVGQITQSIEPVIREPVPGARQHPALVQTQTSRQQSEPTSDVSRAGSHPQVVWPEFSDTKFPAAPAREPAPAEPESPPPFLIPAPERKKSRNIAIGLLIMAILPILVGLIIGANLMSGPYGGPANSTPVIPIATSLSTQLLLTTSTPEITITLVPESTQVLIPSTGVWVRVSYPGTYMGLIGTTGNQSEVTDTGDHLYPIPAGARTVTASLEKEDGSADQILLEVYRDGLILKRESSITPNGIVEMYLDLNTL